MENASDALKMAFAIFVFIVALSIVFSLFSSIKETADTVLYYSDKTNYYDWETGSQKNGRIVGVDTIIATLKSGEGIRVKIENDLIESSEIEDTIKYLIENDSDTTYYTENIIEINTSGEYITAEDGTQVVVQPAIRQIYVLYNEYKEE